MFLNATIFVMNFQKVMKEQQIELHDVQTNHLETDKEKTPQS